MHPCCRAIATMILVLSLSAGCVPTKPAATPIPPTNASPTDTPEEIAPPAAPSLHNSENALIAFYSERDGNAELYTMNADGSEQRRLTFNQFEDSAPAWSPDGSRIVFISDRDDPQAGACFPDCLYQLYIISANGSDERKLAETDFTTHHPDWHPDGTKLRVRKFTTSRIFALSPRLGGVCAETYSFIVPKLRYGIQPPGGYLCHQFRWQRSATAD